MRRAIVLSVAVVAATLSVAAAGPAATAQVARTAVLESAISVNRAAGTATLPLFEGRTAGGQKTWYVVTESSNRADAGRRGVNYAPKLANARGTRAVQRATLRNGIVRFAGTVNFGPRHRVVAGPTGFPPRVARPGSVGDARYSNLVTVGGGPVLNAEQIANNTGRHDKVVRIDFGAGRVTVQLTEGRQGGDRVLYLSTESSDRVGAALEASTYVPRLNAVPGVGSDDADTSARTGLVAAVNGPTGRNNPQRQGLTSAVLGEGDPLNVLQWPATHDRYSPLWDVHPAVWTDAAIDAGERVRLESFSEVAGFVGDGIDSGGNGPANPDLGGLRAGGFIVNCPIIAQF
jgi:hypothetical protein